MSRIRSWIVALLAAATVVGGGGVARADWTQFQHDPGHTGRTLETTITSANVSELAPAWRTRIGRNGFYVPGGVRAEPAIAGGVVYVGSDDRRLYAIDAADGTIRWPTGIGFCAQMTAPAVWGRRVLSSWGPCKETSGGATGAFRTGNGAETWADGIDGEHSSVTVRDGVAYVIGNGIPIYPEVPEVEAFDVADGTLEWTSQLAAGSLAAPAAGADRLYVLAGPTLLALSRDDGSVAWSVDVSDLRGPSSSLGQVTLARGRVLVAADRGVAAFDPADGSRLWTNLLGVANGMAVAGRTAYVTGERLTAIRIGTGTIRWSRGIASPFAPSVAGDLVWIGNGRVHAVDRETGRRAWVSPRARAAGRGAPFTTPVVDGDTVVAAIQASVFAWRLPPG